MTAKKVRPGNENDSGAFHARAPKPRPKTGKPNEAFGLEGSNKTIARPRPDSEASEETVNPDRSRFIPRTPYTRG